MHLTAENKDLKEKNTILIDKLNVVEVKLNEANNTNIVQETLLKNWYNPHDKMNESLKKTFKTFWFKRYNQQIANLKSNHMSTVYKLKISYAKQIEDLQEMIGHMTDSINELASQKSDHGAKLVEIIKVQKEKYQELKTQHKHCCKKLEQSEKYCQNLISELSASETQNTKSKRIIEDSKREINNLQAKNKELAKKLFKFKTDHSTVDLDPFEMHQ